MKHNFPERLIRTRDSGPPVAGIYPELSRTILADLAGCRRDTIRLILSGRLKPSSALAGELASIIGITTEQFWKDLSLCGSGLVK